MKTQDDARKLPPTAQQAIREKAVKAVLTGKTRVEVAQMFGVSRIAVNGWVKKYQSQGKISLKAKKRGPDRGGQLNPQQSATIVKLVQNNPPEKLGLPFVLWTREAVQELIEQRCGIKLSRWTVGRYLKQWGFTPQKPIRRAYEQDQKAVEKWLKEDYPKIQALAKKQNALIFWEDEMGIRSDHQAGRSYGRKGQTPVIPKTGKRFGCNMISAINNRGKMAFSLFEGSFDQSVCITFLRRLIRHTKGKKVFVIWDGHPVHKGKIVKDWIEKHKTKIQVFQLPGYSPELNPDELFNQDIKTNAVGRKNARSKDELKKNVLNYARSIQSRPNRVVKFFLECHVQYASSF